MHRHRPALAWWPLLVLLEFLWGAMRIQRHLPLPGQQPSALTLGNFDGLHLGHQAMIELLRANAARQGLTSCLMTFEPHPREFFSPGAAPARLTALRDKLACVAALGVQCAYVRRFNRALASMTADRFIEDIIVAGLRTRWLLVGDDFRFGAQRQGDVTLLMDAGRVHGFEVVQMSSVEIDGMRVSSTAVRDGLARGDLDYAARLLGRPYSISGRVVGGRRLGRQLGFPTANLELRQPRVPLRGIFVIEAAGLGQAALPGVASLGLRPTVEARTAPLLEVHLLDFAGDLYGTRIEVRFLHKLRDEEKYSDLQQLQKQIALDVQQARAFFATRPSNRLH